MHHSGPELLAPAGSFDTALAAFNAGADAVYLGMDAFSARAEAENFSFESLRLLVAHARRLAPARKIYVTFNTLVQSAELPEAIDTLARLEESGVDGIIVQDLGVARIVRTHFPKLPLHASTQLVAHNLEGVLALKEMGFSRVVLARELSIAEIRSIAQRCGVELETFIHGALCYSLSGLCLFSAMERERSGNRGRCAYCCRAPYTDAGGARCLPFSMRDLRLDDSLDALRDAGVASLKIEGRMKSPLYVASVTAYYRRLLDGSAEGVTAADLETVFSRRTTKLYFDGAAEPARQTAADAARVIDPDSLGHLGTPIGTVKRLTKDREGRTWLRFHNSRAVERHDGLQFASRGAKPVGFGVTDLRVALSRKNLFSVPAGSDIEVLVPEALLAELRKTASAAPDTPNPLAPGATVYCSASNAVKRQFLIPAFRPSEVAAGIPVDINVTIGENAIAAACAAYGVSAEHPAALTPARNPENTAAAVHKAMSRLGGTGWTLRDLEVDDPRSLYAPASALNELRRALVEKLDAAREEARSRKIARALAEIDATAAGEDRAAPRRVLKIRADQTLPQDALDYDELVVAIGRRNGREAETALADIAKSLRTMAEISGDAAPPLRAALPVYTPEPEFNRLRTAVKHLVNAGINRWEAADLATLRLLRNLGLEDITADWTLYSFNPAALAELRDLGAARCVASPEASAENLQRLAAAAAPPELEFLERQSTPLFISLTRPAAEEPALLTGLRGDQFTANLIDGLWVTTRIEPIAFNPPDGRIARTDLSWTT